jgi:LytS/YehU family sensor histidine kinase
VYRYVLEVQNEELVMLDKEVEFARNYLELQQIRFGDKLSYALDIDASVEGMIPPLALQLLLENVLKHNGASHDNPLRVSIYIEDGMLVVKNNRQKRNGREAPSGIGLANIRERYRFFTDKQVEIEEKQGFFIASLPLISKLDTA